MSRIEPLHPENATGKTKDLLDGVQKKLGMVPNMMRTMAVAPQVLEGYLQLSGALGAGVLTAKQREQIALTVAQLNDCNYCLAAHCAIGGMVGLSKEEIGDSRAGTAVDAESNAVLRLATAIVKTRGHVSDTDLATARTNGLNDAAIAEVVANVALNLLTNYFNSVSATTVDFPAAPKLEVVPSAN